MEHKELDLALAIRKSRMLDFIESERIEISCEPDGWWRAFKRGRDYCSYGQSLEGALRQYQHDEQLLRKHVRSLSPTIQTMLSERYGFIRPSEEYCK